MLLAGGASAAELFGRVVAVGDGDTFTLLDESRQQHKVRLSAIDAPERRQAYGERARQHLSSLIYAKSVLVVWDKRDRYGRIVGRVLTAECAHPECRYAIDVGLAQIKAGFAWHYKQYDRTQSPAQRRLYAWVEEEARARRDGLWQEPQPVAPWDYRSRRRPPSHISFLPPQGEGWDGGGSFVTQ